VRLEGLGKFKISSDLIGTRSRYLPACSILPQPTTLRYSKELSEDRCYHSVRNPVPSLLSENVQNCNFDGCETWSITLREEH
jgi:hypothetical protein